MESARKGDKIIARLNKGEEIVQSIEDVCTKHDITLGEISAIGAVNNVKIGLYNPEKKDYDKTVFNENMELCSLVGNVTTKDGDIYPHLHVTLADENYTIKGGHLYRADIIATCEVVITEIEGTVERQHDPETELDLMSFSS